VITINKTYFESKADNSAEQNALLIWILAHEVSHHLHNDMGFDDRIEAGNLIKEILADQRAGYAVGKTTNVGIEFFDNILPKILSNTSHTSTHPSRRYRILAAKGGWLQAKMENVSDGGSKTIGGKTYKKVLQSDGDKVLGEISNGGWNGFSFKIYNNGDVFAGNFQNGLRSGYSVYLYKESESDFTAIYFGRFSAGDKNGQGSYYWASGDKYVGEWKDGEMEGQGTYYYPSGNKYVGEWKNDNRNGYGTLYFSDGSIHEGLWKDNKRHGRGVYYRGSTVIQSGCWQNDEYVGETCE
jgi:hypothetical protein